jgi:hypothetical protein
MPPAAAIGCRAERRPRTCAFQQGIIIGEANLPELRNQRVPDQMVGPLGPAGPRPNNVLMLLSSSDGDIGVWINAPL